MVLYTGTRLGLYEILSPIGAGGMGQVHRARDTRLHRDVAIKVPAERFSERFIHEARSIAALNHTNARPLYDVGPDYLVLELFEVETLRGPMSFQEALPMIRQLIDGIEAPSAIVHRDLKPANIKITPEGVVKIRDFGLAKASAPEPDGDPESSPTDLQAIGDARRLLDQPAAQPGDPKFHSKWLSWIPRSIAAVAILALAAALWLRPARDPQNSVTLWFVRGGA